MESIEDAQELVLPASSQQLAIENERPETESIKELKKLDTTIPQKNVVTPESDYNSLYKSIESAGKTVGETVEKSKAASAVKDLSGGKINTDVVLEPTKITVENAQVAAPLIALKEKVDDLASKATLPTKEKVDESVAKTSPSVNKESATIELLPTKATNDASPATTSTISTKEKTDESLSITPPAEKVLATISKDSNPSKKATDEITLSSTESNEGEIGKSGVTSQTIDNSVEKASSEKSTPTSAADLIRNNKGDESVVSTLEKVAFSKVDAVIVTTPSTEKDAQASISKSEAVDEKSLAQKMEAAGKAGSDLVQSTIPTDKQALDTPMYDSLFKKIEAAGKAPDENVKQAENAREQVSSSDNSGITSSSVVTEGSNTETSKLTTKETSVDTITSVSPSPGSTEETSQDASSGGVYMKEAVSALSSLGLPKLNVPLSNSPEYKLPAFNGPEISMPSFNMPELKLPSLNIPELSIPNINLPSTEGVPLVAKVAAGVLAVSGTGVAIALALNGEETVGSTMPIGAKKKGSSYLEGLSRSSTTLPNKAENGSSSGSNSYLNNLAANAVVPPRAPVANAPYDFSPKPFDPGADPSNNNARPAVTTVQESNVSPSFNFAPSANANTGKESAQSNSVTEGNNRGAPNGEKKSDSSGPSFNFSPKMFDLASKRGSAAMNGQDTNGNLGPKPEPPMGGESLSDASKSDKYDWGNTSVDGGYVWRDPVQPNAGSGVGSYLDNLASKNEGPNPFTSPTNPSSGSYNSYLDAMNRQPNQQSQDSNQPTTVKTFSKTPRTGSYVDSL